MSNFHPTAEVGWPLNGTADLTRFLPPGFLRLS